ncbi:MAG: DUF134 domain-containing protein [Lentisphaerota bacterium]
MPRPHCLRHIAHWPDITYFKPAGVPLRALEEVVLALDELEALRLADLDGLYQEQAAERMKISRPTFARVVESARQKVADALINGKALRLEGGSVTSSSHGHSTKTPFGCCGRGHRRGAGWVNQAAHEGEK